VQLSSKQKIMNIFFYYGTLLPMRFLNLIFGIRIWPPLNRLNACLTRIVARHGQKRFKAVDGEHVLKRFMDFTDHSEGQVGIFGDWEIVDENTVLRKVYQCPFAERISDIPEYCLTLGTTMGQEAAEVFYPDHEVYYRVRKALSNGDKNCEYFVQIQNGGDAKK